MSAKVYPDFEYVLHFDGSSKGNPGIGGAGAVIYKEDKEIWSYSSYVGEKVTNNHAEYAGLILGLHMAYEMGIPYLLVKGDSQLVINQMTGLYKCKSSNLMDLYKQAKELETKFKTIKYVHVLREFNKRADELSNNFRVPLIF